MKEQMQSIPIQEFLVREKVPVDVFILIGGEKFLLVAKFDQSVEPLKRYMEKGLDRVYIRLSDHPHLIHLTINEAAAAADSAQASGLTRITNLQVAMSTVYREIQETGMDETVFNHVKMVNHVTLTLIGKTPRLTDLIWHLASSEPDMIRYSMMVSMISSMIGVAHEWTKPGTIEKLALGGFLHEIGRTKLPAELLHKHPSQMSHDEKVIFQGHPEIGYQLLVQIKAIPEDVQFIVWEHHERADGSGYPRKLKDLQMNPLAKVVALASAFCDEYLTVSDEDESEKARIALERITTNSHLYNKDAVRALRKLFPFGKAKAAG